ncbi:CBS domain-containing protein [Pseudonocardia endophytica]|uniref:CBS domain-containing protein n=1 Tax=Pseudonocardia endophytica TaxID=401976 RepID=A0A4R1I000_PSEEN|nr:CBS domain-containing protein [Pseudonocardia endophytica]TCK26825.1 CBS domain-containing protein [Pseudonocardia endophytica]
MANGSWTGLGNGAARTVGSAMIRRPKVCGPETTVAEVRDMFSDDHVHCVLVVDGGVLLAVVEPMDLFTAPPDAPASTTGRLAGRVVGPDADLHRTWRSMESGHRRRLAVVGPGNALAGLLCLKRSGRGFCSDTDVADRAVELGRALPPPIGGVEAVAADAPSCR